MNDPCVYVLTNERNSLFYIGHTQNIDGRLKAHISQLRCGTHSNVIFQKNYIPGDSLRITCFHYQTLEEARKAEIKAIKSALESRTAYLMTNILITEGFGDALTLHPDKDKIIAKRTATARERTLNLTTAERSKRWGKPGELNPMFGRTHTPEVRKRLSEAHLGHHRGIGRKLSPEHIKSISERAKLRTGDKNSFYGRKHSDKTKEFLRNKFKGNIPPNALKLIAEGLQFNSYAEAARHFKISNELVRYRVNKSKYPDWYRI